MSEEEKIVRILFVDDEDRVLRSLQRFFEDEKEDWETAFVSCAKDALDLMEKTTFDIVVTDIRMPDMDGSELLSIMCEKHPESVRFVLSGNTDKDVAMKALGTADQFISKPCAPEALVSKLEDALRARSIVDDKNLMRITSQVQTLPTLPELYIRLKCILNNPEKSFKDIAEIVAKDVMITTKVLQLVNSAFFGLRHRVENLHRALTYIGVETLKAIILTTDLFGKFEVGDVEKYKIRQLYNHSIHTSLLARKIMQTVVNDEALMDQATMGGMLHDFGKLILIKNKPQEYAEILKLGADGARPIYEIEQELLGVTHAEIAGYIMSKWGLPLEIIKSVQYHHSPDYMREHSVDAASAVYIANILEHQGVRKCDRSEENALKSGYLQKLDLLKYLPEWKEIMKLNPHKKE